MTASTRFLTVGSLLRPENLLKYKRQIEHREDITYPFYDDFEGYKETEDQAVSDVVKKQLDQGLPEISDGEFSKSLWHLDFVWGWHGVKRFIAGEGYHFKEKSGEGYETRRDVGIEIVDRLSGKNHPFISHFKRLKGLAEDADVSVKQCIPSPSHIYGELTMNDDCHLTYYQGDHQAFREDLVRTYKEFLDDYVEAGGKIIQFDDCLWEIFAEDNSNNVFTGKAVDREETRGLAQTFIDLNNEVIDYGHTLGLRVYTHNCRGNYESRGMSEGSYSNISNLFFKQQHYDRFYLEWDDERAGDLSALSAFTDRPEVEVVVGLMSSKKADLDDEKRILDRLEEATKYVPKDRLYLSHQCGFASCDSGNNLSEDQQWAKISQGQEIAYSFWGE